MSSIITFTYCSKWNHLIYMDLSSVKYCVRIQISTIPKKSYVIFLGIVEIWNKSIFSFDFSYLNNCSYTYTYTPTILKVSTSGIDDGQLSLGQNFQNFRFQNVVWSERLMSRTIFDRSPTNSSTRKTLSTK